MIKICLFGGTFDPVHNGHLTIAAQAVEILSLDSFIFIPAFIPPHKAAGQVTSPAHRLAMLNLAVADLPAVTVSDHELRREGISYTVETVRYFKKTLPEDDILFLTGADSLEHLHLWKEVNRLLSLCRVIVIPRPGCSCAMTPELHSVLSETNADRLEQGFTDIRTPDLSSTLIRNAVAEGRDISSMVPLKVAEYISQHGLYAGPGQS